MKKNKAFTFIELATAVLILGIVFTVLLKTVKPQKANLNPFFIATYNNIQKANEELVYKNKELNNEGLPTDYCTKLSEMFSTKSANCAQGEMVLLNGVKLSGLIDNFTSDTTDIIATFTKGEEETSHTFSVYKATGDVVPSGNDINSDDVFKFRVFSEEEGSYVEDTKNGVSFQDAVCIIGSNSQYNVTCNQEVNENSCPYPGMCRYEVVMPKGANF